MNELYNLQANTGQNRGFKKSSIIFGILAVAVLAAIFYFAPKILKETKEYEKPYRLVNEKISQSAAIVVSLPESVEKTEAQGKITFEPAIAGDWVETENKDELIFKPKEKLNLNRYYLATLALAEGGEQGEISADFLAVEDPEIIAVFPHENSEASENSEITIVFNRPMVPLTTLDELESKDLPVEISPETKGRFKWQSTRNLQFIPEERLVRSSNYTVKIGSGLVSMDNLALSGKELHFTTRKLRYTGEIGGKIVYNQPISVYFNQPIDLEKTKPYIHLTDAKTGQEIPFTAEFPKEKDEPEESNEEVFLPNVFDRLTAALVPGFLQDDEAEEEKSASTLNIYKKEDRFNREKLWDFESSYVLKIDKVFPAEGDIVLQDQKTISANVGGPIENFFAESLRTNYASPEFFDPQGKLGVQFYEEIDLARSVILADRMKEITYGEKCKDEEKTYGQDVDCEKVPDKKKIFITFFDSEIGRSQTLKVLFEKIVNTQGLIVNKETIARAAVSYPEFRITKTSPGNGAQGAAVNSLKICSNSPINAPANEDQKKAISANLDMEIKYWGSSWLISVKYPETLCNVGEFETRIDYGLMPLSSYEIELKLEDVFSQTVTEKLAFDTAKMPSTYLSFYHLQDRYNVALPEGSRLTFAAVNMNFVDMHICKIGAEDFLLNFENRPSSFTSYNSVHGCRETVLKRISLPEKYWVKNYFKVDVNDYFDEPLGYYIITFFHPDYFSFYYPAGTQGGKAERPLYEWTFLNVTGLSVVEKRIDPVSSKAGWGEVLSPSQISELKNIYWVTDMKTLEPVEGAKVVLEQNINSQRGALTLKGVNSFETGRDGLAFTDVLQDIKGAIITKGKDSTVLPNYESKVNYASSAYSASKAYLYTDKPIYRPGEQVFFKGIFRKGYDGNYNISNEKIKITIRNSRWDVVLEKELDMNDFGSLASDFVLAADSPLGMYSICVENVNCVYFDVQEYVPASFEVVLTTDKEEYVSKETVKIKVEANYYFGVPLERGEVTYTISSQDYYFDRYQDEFFSFGSGWYYFPPYEYGDKFLLRDKASIGENGIASISQVLDFEKLFKDAENRSSKIIIMDATVVNSQGQSVSSQKSFIVHAGEFYLGIRPEKSFLAKDEKTEVKIKSVDTEGKEISVSNGTLNVYEISWSYNKRMASNGRYLYIWEQKREFIRKFDFSTDRNGNYSRDLSFEKEGSYELEAKAKDKKGNTVFSTYDIYVYGKNPVSVRPTQGTELEVKQEKVNLNVGEEASLMIKSPYNRAKAFITIERGKVFEYYIEEIEGSLYKFSFSIKEEYVPNVFASITLVSPKPEVKYASAEFKIGTETKELEVEVISNKNQYLPGEEVTLEIKAADSSGAPVSAEVSLAVVDLSVLALKGNPKKNPVIFFYGNFPLTVSTAVNVKDILVELKVPTKGGGGGAPSPPWKELAPEDEASLARKKRGEFKETAFWQAMVRTDEQGRAQVKFVLPDNLTAWQIESLAVTRDTKLGVDYIEFLTKKNLMLVPLKPRFIIPGDVFFVGAKVFNQSEQKQTVRISFESATLSLIDSFSEKKIDLDPGTTNTIYFKVEAPLALDEGKHLFELSAKSRDFEDTVLQEIKITRNETYESVATANYTSDSLTREYVFLPEGIIKDRGELSIKASATLAVFLSDSLNYLISYPYGCSEQIASRLEAIAIVKKGLNLPNLSDKLLLKKIEYEGKEYTIDEAVEIGLSELYQNQNYDGGFSYWREAYYSSGSNFYLTLTVVDALKKVKAAGYDVSENVLQKASDYIYKKITSDKNLASDKNTVILASYTLSNPPQYTDPKLLYQKLEEMAKDELFLNEQISNVSLTRLAMVFTEASLNETLKKKIFETMDNRINIDARGAFLEVKNSNSWWYYETSVKNTALYLKALSLQKTDNAILDKTIRWLLNSRYKDGSWGSTQNTLSSIDAFTEFLLWKRETESQFDLAIFINNKNAGSFGFNKDTILDQFRKDYNLSELLFNKLNTIEFSKKNLNNLENNYYYDISLKYYLPVDKIAPRDEGFTVSRQFFRLDDKENKNPLSEAKVGDVLRGHLQITVPKSAKFLTVEDYIPAGMEIVNLDLATEDKSLRLQERELENREFFASFKEIRDNKLFLFREEVGPGVYEFDYFVRVLIQGRFSHLPAIVSEMYFPENFGRTAGEFFEVK